MLPDCFYRPALTSIFVLGMCFPSTAVLIYTCVCSGNVSLRVFLTWSWRSQHPSVPCFNRCHKERKKTTTNGSYSLYYRGSSYECHTDHWFSEATVKIITPK